MEIYESRIIYDSDLMRRPGAITAEQTAACLTILILFISMIYMAIRRVPEHQRLVIFRLGRCIGARGPGLVILIPFIEHALKVDMREQARQISERFLTRDKTQIVVDLIWRFQIIDPTKSVLCVGNLEAAAKGMICTVLRRALADMDYEDLRLNRSQIAREVEIRLGRVMRDWGTEPKGLEITAFQGKN